MTKSKEIPSCCMNCDMFRVFDGQCAITEAYIDDYLDNNCPLGIVTCKDCESWNKETELCKHWTDAMSPYCTICTGADFYCEDAKGKNK